MGNEALHSIGKGMWKDTTKLIRQRVSRVSRNLAWVLNDLQNLACQKLFKFQYVLLTWPISRVGTHELVMKSSFSQNLYQTLIHNPHINSHKNIGKWLNRITINFDTKLKPTLNIVVNHNFTYWEWETTHLREQLGAPKFLDIIIRNNSVKI